MAVRNSTASISLRAFLSAFSMMSSVMGSTSTFLKGVVLVWIMRAGMSGSQHWQGKGKGKGR